MSCMCEWPAGCNGTGIVHCDGCGGDLCICRCGGEDECPGCDACGDGFCDEEDLADSDEDHVP